MLVKSLISSREAVVDLEPWSLLVFWPQPQSLFTQSYAANLLDMASEQDTLVWKGHSDWWC